MFLAYFLLHDSASNHVASASPMPETNKRAGASAIILNLQ